MSTYTGVFVVQMPMAVQVMGLMSSPQPTRKAKRAAPRR